MAHSPSAGANEGFTLLEVIVAFVVLSFVLTAALMSISYSVRLYRRSDDVLTGQELAERLIAEKFASAAKQPPMEEGATEEGFEWKIKRISIQDEFTPSGDRLMQFELRVLNRQGLDIGHYKSFYVENRG